MSDPPIILDIKPSNGKPGKYLAVALNGVGELHRDNLDLNSAVSRKRFIGATMQKAFKDVPADDWPADVRSNLEEQLIKAAAIPPGNPEPPTKTTEKEPEDLRIAELDKMPEAIRIEADAMLRDPELLKRIHKDIETLGVVGEKENSLLIYLAGTSAQLKRPISIISRGASSSGKSFLIEQVSRFFPDEIALHATQLTTNALFYFEPGTLRHRFVVAGERSRIHNDDEKAEATRALREMIEAGELSKAVPIKEGDRMVTKIIKQKGPIAFIESASQGIDDEDANRCLLIGTDESEAQTRRIIAATATAAQRGNHSNIEHIISVHHAIQRMIPRAEVVVPFAETIARLYGTTRLETRRDFRHLLQLVRASALLHFNQRERNLDGAIVAGLNDYAIAERLAREPFGSAACGISESARTMLRLLREKFDTREFVSREANGLGGLSNKTIYRRILELNSAGAVEQTQAGKGRVAAKWKVSDLDTTSERGVLPSVDAVRTGFRCPTVPQVGK